MKTIYVLVAVPCLVFFTFLCNGCQNPKTAAAVEKLTADQMECVLEELGSGATDPKIIAAKCAPTLIEDVTLLVLARQRAEAKMKK